MFHPKRQLVGLRIFLVALTIVQLYLPAWADYRLTDQNPEDVLGVEPAKPEPPPAEEPMPYSQEDWNKARETVETPPTPPPAAAQPKTPSPSAEPVPGISVDLPYESGLTISGRKLIAFKLSQTRRRSAHSTTGIDQPKSTNDVEMRQELQVRIKGKVGRKISVNVDFDDTKEDKRDISVVYQGDPGEFVQEAAFGDITLSLPSTEFVSYSKQLFGVRTKLQYKNAQLMAIGSRTKGTTETRRFNGATKFERRQIRDLDYRRKEYYNIAYFPGAIAPGSETVWRDDRDVNNNIQTSTSGASITENFLVEDATTTTAQFRGDFDRLIPGQDYVIDYRRGFIQIKRSPVADNAAYAIDYAYLSGGRLSDQGTAGLPKMVKAPPSSDQIGGGTVPTDRWEYKTFYSLGNPKIVRDNGRGNFILRTVDLNGNDLLVPLDSGNLLGYPSTIEVDFDLGVFNIALSSRVADSSLYDPVPANKFNFLTEYRYRLRDYQIRPNIVFNSERVTVNGRLLRSEIDYFIDYQTGLLQFFNEDELDENSQIEVTYEFAPFGGQLGQTLVGTRAELAIVPGRFTAGSTFLYTFAPKTDLVPDVRATPSSLMVLEADGRITDLAVPLTPVKISLTGEAAQSRENPNLFGKAIVDSMEGIRQEDGVTMDLDNWQYASKQSTSTGGSYGAVTRPSSMQLNEEEVPLRDVVGNPADVSENEKLRTIRAAYNLATKPGGGASDPEESSIVQSISKAGRDFSKKIFMELWIEGSGSAGANVDLEIDGGSFNEDADLDSNLDTEDANRDGTLNQNEDAGFNYDFGGNTFPQGANNGRIDSEDLDGDGILRVADAKPRTVPLFKLSNGIAATDQNGNTATITDLSFTRWRFIRVPLSISSGEEDAFRSIRQVRVTLRGLESSPGVPRAGSVRFGKIAFVGNTWETPIILGSGQMNAIPINNLDNPDYQSLLNHPAYHDLYGDQADDRTREQALLLDFSLSAGSTATTRSAYGAGRDFSKHKSLNFFYQVPQGQPPGATLFFQIGSDVEYFEWSLPLTAAHVGSWSLETLQLVDANSDGTPDSIQSTTPGATVRTIGLPSLARVGQIKIGLRNNTGGPITSQVWVNEIHVSGANIKVGNARRFAADGTWNRWGSFGGVVRSVDRNFQTLTSPIVNQDRDEATAYANLSRWRYAPLSGNFSRVETVTPAALRTGQSDLVSVLSEGREKAIASRLDGQFIFPHMPALAYSVDRNITESTDRQERRDRNTYTGSLDYALPWRPDLLPGQKFALRPLPESVFVKYSRTNFFLSFFPERLADQLAAAPSTTTQATAIFANSTTREFTDDWTGRMGFTLWNGLTVTPTYAQTTVREERRFGDAALAFAPQFGPAQAYDKAFSQSQGLAASWRLLRWLEPRFNYSLSGTEVNGLPTASSPTASGVKTLDRSGIGDLFLTLAPRDVLPRFRPIHSLNVDMSLRAETSDTHENIPGDFRDWAKIRMFKLSKIDRRDGRTMYGWLEPLDLTNPGSRRKQLTARNQRRFSGNWTPLDWLPAPLRLTPFKTLNLTGTYTDTDEHTDNTETVRDVNTLSWPDLIASLRDMEKLVGLQKWMMGSQLNIRTNKKRSETFREELSLNQSHALDYRFTLFTRYDFFASWARTEGDITDLATGLEKSQSRGMNHSYQVGTKFGSWRLTPSATFRDDITRDGSGRALQDLNTQTYAVIGRLDKTYTSGFRLPFSRKVFTNVNRLTLDAKASYERRTSSINVERDNTDTYAGEATGEWEIARNFRFSFGGKTSLIDNRNRPEDSLITIELNTQLVIQF